MPATLYAEGETVERLYNEWARTLQSIKQHGCVVQLRHDVWPDGGRAIASHIRAQAPAHDTYMPARMRHTVGLKGTEGAARGAVSG